MKTFLFIFLITVMRMCQLYCFNRGILLFYFQWKLKLGLTAYLAKLYFLNSVL